jgi:hypothetical protein
LHAVVLLFKLTLQRTSLSFQVEGFSGYSCAKPRYGWKNNRSPFLLLIADEEAEEEADDNKPQYDKLTMPELIVCFDASDGFLRQRVMELPENIVVGTHNTEDGLQRRLVEYRSINTDDETVLNYFDELEFHPEHIGSPV